MHYYKRNLGDYAKKAGRLSMLQHGSYTLLIDSCYDREQFPTLEQAIEWTWASSTEEIEAVKFVLSKFFVLSPDGTYIQDWILQELIEYHAKADINKRIAIDRETKRKENITNRVHTVNASTPNQEPITKNQEPRTNNQEPITNTTKPQQAVSAKSPKFDVMEFFKQYDLNVNPQVLTDWLKIRKGKRLVSTETAFRGFIDEVRKTGMSIPDAIQLCCVRGWGGLDAKWLGPKSQMSSAPKKFDPSEYVNNYHLKAIK